MIIKSKKIILKILISFLFLNEDSNQIFIDNSNGTKYEHPSIDFINHDNNDLIKLGENQEEFKKTLDRVFCYFSNFKYKEETEEDIKKIVKIY